VDEIRAPLDWESVVVHGTAYFLNPDGEEDRDFRRAVRVLRRIDPRILTNEDTAPARTTLFRIHINELRGRVATPQVPTRR
jgi:nitroimidazol reductase NimA-like FMN-containing flavoprotein (pyridoxamine 5'-phosphate oxidase superfamily)